MSGPRPDEAWRSRDGGTTDARRPAETHPRPAGATASADAVEKVRRSITDLKHDVRMLKVVLDKQTLAIERVLEAVEHLGDDEEE